VRAPGIVAAPARVSVLEHTVAQARARVLMDTRVDALRRWQARDADRDGTAADKLRALTESALASTLLRDWPRADAAFAGAAAIARASPNSSARAERAVLLMQAQSQLDRGAPAQAAETMKPYAGDGSRPSLLLGAQVALMAAPALAPDNATLKTNAAALQTWVAVHPDRLARVGRARPDLGPARRAAALDPRRSRGALRARRLSRRHRPVARGPAAGTRRRAGRLHRRVGARFAPARGRGGEKADPRRPEAGALTGQRASSARGRESFAQNARTLRSARTGGS
jgi:hypothetical protein